MPIFAILSDDGLSIREIRNFDEGTVFKPGKAFPVTYAEKPVFDPTLSSLVEVWNLPVKGTVTVTWDVVDLPQLVKDNNAKLDALKRLFDEAEVIDDAWATATNAQKFDLARNTFKILRRIRGFILDQYRS
jgi:hypothetical protein